MVNIFQNREASKKFVSLSNRLKGNDKKKFSGFVKATFVKKSTSEDGVYKTFKVEVGDLDNLFNLVLAK